MNINFDSNLSKDEIGSLTKDVYGLVHVIKDMVDDLAKTYHEFIEIGNTHYAIDTSKYHNSYAEMIEMINILLSAVTADIEDVADTLSHIADGNFDRNMNTDNWGGDWVVMPTALNKLSANLKAVNFEIGAMIDSILTKGDLNFKIDDTKYLGDWRKLMIGLNNIAIAVDTPIRSIGYCMEEIKAGNFDLEKLEANIRASCTK